MYAFTTRLIVYKSYKAKEFSIRMSSNGTDPQHVTVKVLNTKKPTAEVRVDVGYFSESRGYGGTTGKFVRLTDPELVALCKATLVDDSAIAGLVDMLTEKAEFLKYAGNRLVSLISRWWVLAQQENPSGFVSAERRQRAYDDKRFNVGDRVVYWSRHGLPDIEATITSEKFDWADWSGGGWRFGFEANGGGYNVLQTQLRGLKESVGV